MAAMDFLRAQSSMSSYLNVLQSMVDTSVARIGKRRAMPVIGADDAEYSEKLYARRASRVLRKKMATPAIERMMPMFLRDGVVRGDGCIHVMRRGGDAVLEKFPRSELVFDDGESRNGSPLTLARVRMIDRTVLTAQYPEFAERIRDVTAAPRDYWDPTDYDSPMDPDQIEVITAWRLPSHPGAGDGCTLTCIRDGEAPLDERLWKRSRFPIARVQWTPSMRGFLGIGLIQQLAGSQNKVNELWSDHQLALHWASQLTVFVPRGSNIPKSQLRGRDPKVVEYDGGVPSYIAPDPASKQAMDSLRWLIQQMYEVSGISQAAASSRNPLGPNASGKALDTFMDIESDRFSQLELQYAMGRVDVGMALLDEAKDIAALAAEDDSIEPAPWIDEIDWEKFDFDGGNYHLMPEPENFIPSTRGGRLDALQDMAKIPGLLNNPLITASLFEEPDIARANRHLLGPYRQLEKLMEMLGDEKIPQEMCVPTPYMLSPPGLAKEMALGELGNAFSEGAGDALLGRYRWFLQMLEDESLQAMPPAPPPMAPGPPGAEMPPPPMGMSPGMPPGPGGVPFIGPSGGPMQVPDPMGGATSQLAAGMSPFGPM
jgi:hypothetical protein